MAVAVGKDPFLILPEEMWEMIFDYLPEADELLNVRKVHAQFAGILNRKSRLWMFQKVIPHVLQYLERSDVLNCRRVCQPWNNGIVKYFERHFSVWPASEPAPPYSSSSSSAFTLFDGILLCQDTVQRFHNDLEQRAYFRTHPALGRHFTIDWTDEDGGSSSDSSDEDELFVPIRLGPSPKMKAFWNKSLEILTDARDHIWYLTISVETDDFQMSDATLYYYLQRSLTLLPNLKSVILKGDLGLFSSPTKVLRTLRRHPLPQLQHLQSFIIEVTDLTSEVEGAIYSSYGPQLKNVRMGGFLLNEKYTSNDLINFTQLHLHTIRSERLSELAMHLNWCRLRCPLLQKLTLEAQVLKLATIHVILDCCPVLQVLKVKCRNEISSCIVLPGDCSSRPTRNTSLHTLEITDTALQSYDFLGCVPSLQHLVLQERRSWETFVSVVLKINLHGFLEPPDADVYRSRVWNILASLKKLIYVDTLPAVLTCYTREKRENFIQQRINL